MSKELAVYLKEKKGLNRLFLKLKDKYISLNRYSGTITLDNLSEVEQTDISNLLGRKVDKNLKTSFKEITKKINQGKYRDFNWQDLFKYYFNDTILSNSDKKSIEDINEEQYFAAILTQNKESIYIDILKEIIEEDSKLHRLIRNKYKQNKLELQQDLNNIFLLLNNLPTTPTSLPVFASITGNPHYLDLNKSKSDLFLKVLSYIKKEEMPTTTKDKIELLSQINIYIDPISNFVITYKLIGNDILSLFAKSNQVVNLNLQNIMSFDSIDTKDKKVFIFENPSLLNEMLDLNIPIIITSGNPNISLYKVLEKLTNNGNKLYYNGDFDPEGLLIAQNLKQKFPELQLFCYQEQDYNQALSHELVTSSRLKKLDNINIQELQVIKNKLLETSLSAYQESNINRIKDYIVNKKYDIIKEIKGGNYD